MGLDFSRRAARTFTKGWNKGAEELSRPNLFTRYPECRTRTVVANLVNGATLTPESKIMVMCDSTRLLVLQDLTPVACVDSPPPDLFRAISQDAGYAAGSIVRINPLSGTVDVAIE